MPPARRVEAGSVVGSRIELRASVWLGLWSCPLGRFIPRLSAASRRDCPPDSVAAAVAFDESLESLGGLDAENRKRLSLYALLAQTVLAGLGTAVGNMKVARPEGFEPPTTRFEAWYSIQLSYGRLVESLLCVSNSTN